MDINNNYEVVISDSAKTDLNDIYESIYQVKIIQLMN